MLKRILLPLDGSQIAEKALPYGEELAGRLGSELVLYHVQGNEPLRGDPKAYLDRLAQTVKSSIKKSQPKGAEVIVATKVETGEPVHNICNVVEKDKVDLIIMTAVSETGLKIGKMLGGVTDQICRTVPIPVMLVRPQHNGPIDAKGRLINRALITLDGSPLSKLALPVVEELASKLKIGVTLFQMTRLIRYYGDGLGGSLHEDEEKQVEGDMIKIETEMKQKGIDVTHWITVGLDAGDEIIDMSKKTGADLVVMSTHGRSGLGRWLIGSVAEKVLRHGETSLLLVQARAS